MGQSYTCNMKVTGCILNTAGNDWWCVRIHSTLKRVSKRLVRPLIPTQKSCELVFDAASLPLSHLERLSKVWANWSCDSQHQPIGAQGSDFIWCGEESLNSTELLGKGGWLLCLASEVFRYIQSVQRWTKTTHYELWTLLWDAKEASVRKQKDFGKLILFDHRLFLEEEGDGGWSNNHLCK